MKKVKQVKVKISGWCGTQAFMGRFKKMIVKRKDGYYVVSESANKNLGGPYATRTKALERLRQVEYFKHKGK